MHRYIRVSVLSSALLIIRSITAGSQETADRYFESISSNYKTISDYTAALLILQDDTAKTAQLQYKSPNLLRLDFSSPEGMVMIVSDKTLNVWVPEYRVIFKQTLQRNNQAQTASLATSRGLELMKKHYTVAYDDSPDPVPLDSGSIEKVVKLRLTWKTNNEGFRELILSINPLQKTIRRIRGITTTGRTIVFEFTNIMLNRGIPDTRFNFESPAIGNTIENFLFDPEN